MLLLLFTGSARAGGPVYVVLWFDTEDYIEPSSDDAAMRVAKDLTAAGVPGTFKVVGELARMLEKRGRRDVIEALSKHAIGYHSDLHSGHPTPAEYLSPFGYLDGAAEFARRESKGFADVRRVFHTQPICYGQPGSSWGPQAHPALRDLGVPVYLDEGVQVGVANQPFWYDGLLYVYQMGPNQFRARLDVGAEDATANARFDEAAQRLEASGGGVISIYYHPNEFVTTEFWDAVNFAHGANPPRESWVGPHRRTPEEAERCYEVLRRFVAYMKSRPGVRFTTAGLLPSIYAPVVPRAVDAKAAAAQMRREIVFANIGGQMLSPADMLVSMLGLESGIVDGPVGAGVTTLKADTIPAAAFRAAVADAGDFVRRNKRLPNEVFVGAYTLSLADFTATLAGSILEPGSEVRVARGNVGFERYFATDPVMSFKWLIHPVGFSGAPLLAVARLQGWTLKPAMLK